MYLLAQMFMRDSGYNHMYWAGLWWLLLLAVFVAVVVLIAKSLGNNGSSKPSEISAEELAKQRYAKGEITKKQYEDIIKTINK